MIKVGDIVYIKSYPNVRYKVLELQNYSGEVIPKRIFPENEPYNIIRDKYQSWDVYEWVVCKELSKKDLVIQKIKQLEKRFQERKFV